MGIQGNVFESLSARHGHSSPLFDNSKNLASSSCGMEQSSGMRREGQSSTVPNPSQEMVQDP